MAKEAVAEIHETARRVLVVRNRGSQGGVELWRVKKEGTTKTKGLAAFRGKPHALILLTSFAPKSSGCTTYSVILKRISREISLGMQHKRLSNVVPVEATREIPGSRRDCTRICS